MAGEDSRERRLTTTVTVFRGIRDPRQRALVEVKLAPAPGIEAGALATSMDIVVG